jgi:UDP-MurNAc hydroxylase
MPWLDKSKQEWHEATPDLVATLREWWEPLLAMAPTLRAAVGGNCLVRAGDEHVLIDFAAGTVRSHDGEAFAFSFDIPRDLVETVAAQRAVDWSNALFLSCRFRAWREGQYNEFLYNFFKSLSVERMRRAEAEALRKLDPDRGGIAGEEIRLGDYICQRTCPHRQADLTVFGEIEGDELVCTLHGWRFDLDTGECLSADGHRIRIRRAD